MPTMNMTMKPANPFTLSRLSALIPLLLTIPGWAAAPSPDAQRVAAYAASHFQQAQIDTLKTLVGYDTRARDGLTPDTDPVFADFKRALGVKARMLGLDVEDNGYVMLISLSPEGAGTDVKKVGVITHGDVQPADPSLWPQSPYELTETADGRLVGRGAEDDKGPIATALYAMKAIKDSGIVLKRRIELLVYMAEESDWEPLKDFLKTYEPADINITLDAEYPVVTGEKGWSQIKLSLPRVMVKVGADTPVLTYFSGGSFASQIPQQASAVIQNTNPELVAALKARAKTLPIKTDFIDEPQGLTIHATGKAAHSSTPEDGINAVAYLAELLSPTADGGIPEWPMTTAAVTVDFLHSLVGTGLYGERFGKLGYSDEFMGPMTLAPTLITEGKEGTDVTLNLRRPVGRTPEALDKLAIAAIHGWQDARGTQVADIETYWGTPMLIDDAPHLETLLGVFGHYTNTAGPKPIAIGGSTNAKLFPNALSFGPAMPGMEYTGHSEYEFITRDQLKLNLEMYTAALVELAMRE
ncbi:Xaa-His dipeptidase [Shewanella amazonensis SB2B]|uniref:Xaa-His dipeptidase n=2 Tax=Shewanella amazonensis TaxID=60478 RepID=A1S5W6_SHEAM|nr:Xaa-His dipeptidase [Shewanella amazonensis SB2B]